MHINGPVLRVIRERSGMTVTALAEAAGIRQAHLSNIEAGRRQPSPDVAVSLARALRVDLPIILKDPDEAAAS